MKTMKRLKGTFSVAVILLMLPILQNGCATILVGSSQDITVNSNVPGAEVLFNGKVIGVTPLTTSVSKQIDSILEVRKEGYQPQTINMSTSLTAAFWGNIIIGGLLGSTTDQSTDSAYEYDPGSFQVTLLPEQASQLELDSIIAVANLRRFVLYNYTHIVRDSSVEQGEHLEALSGMLSLKTKEQKRDLAANVLKFYQQSPNAIEFSNQILMFAEQSQTVLQTGKDFR